MEQPVASRWIRLVIQTCTLPATTQPDDTTQKRNAGLLWGLTVLVVNLPFNQDNNVHMQGDVVVRHHLLSTTLCLKEKPVLLLV